LRLYPLACALSIHHIHESFFSLKKKKKSTINQREELIKECDPNATGNLGFLDVFRILARFRFRRDPFGGNRCISNDIPLPLRWNGVKHIFLIKLAIDQCVCVCLFTML
jgi:hypothetical protein